MSVPSRVILRGVFSEPTLFSTLNSDAVWSRGSLSPYFQKSTTGWLANLYGGVQTGDDFASIPIEVNELRIPDFKAAQWTYNLTNAEVYGINMVIWAHDPNDPSKRIEITQAPSHADLAKAAGWNKHILDTSVTQFFFYGENTTGTDLTAGTQYTWDQFQADVLFSNWTIYRISLEYGWYSTGTFEDAWVADIKLNGQVIPLKPDSGGTGRIGRRWVTGSSAIAHALAPKTPFELLSVVLHLNAAATQETFTVTVDAGRAASVYDTLLYSKAMAGVADIVREWTGGLALKEDDEVDSAWTNTDGKTYGLTVTYRTVFEGA
ncbi:hypothetical protein LCGC14_0386110 [marine sediment metagenome]|uniref:Uncharacterized protein n=1 Tax=marine sediment metagenome TaxID=412755 RepID=A0A0F9TJ11_9ZZZZ